MPGPATSVNPAPAEGYASPTYAASLVDVGESAALPRSGGSLLIRPIPHSPWTDACGPYPLLVAPRWAGLRDDVTELADSRSEGVDRQPVSVVAVVTPFADLDPTELQT